MINKVLTIVKKLDRTEKSGIVNMAIKPISLLLSLIYTPLLLSYLGTEKYGLWAVILSVISWINYFDVGIGNGLRNVLSRDFAKPDYEHARKSLSTAYVVLGIISFSLFIIAFLMTLFLDWHQILSTDIDMTVTIIISLMFVCMNFVLSLSNAVLYALQLTEGIAVRGCIAQIINIIGIIILRRHGSGSLESMAILFGGSTFIVYLITTYQIIIKKENYRPSLKLFDKNAISEICNKGIQFFAIQLMCLLMFTVDNLLISHFFGPSSVTPFSVTNKVYNVAYSFLAAFLVPYWSGTTAAIEKGEISWIKESIKKSIRILILYIVGSILLTIVFKPAVRLWLRQDLTIEPGLHILMCVFYILYAILAVECQFINGSGELSVQMIMYIFLGIMNVPLSIFLGVYCGYNAFGVRLATALLVLIADVVLGFNLKNILLRLQNKVNTSHGNL